jgi:hypothetical protein
MNVTWERTVIGGQTAPEDYLARDETGRSIGRVYGHHMSGWFWCFNAFGPDIKWPAYPAIGTEPTKQAAADQVKRVFEMCLRPQI